MKALRLLVLCGSALALCACGFRPLYGTMAGDPGAQAIFASIYVEPVDQERTGYELRNQLIDLLRATDRPAIAAYRLKVRMTETREGVALQNDATITRYDLAFKANYELTDAKAKSVMKGLETTLESFDVANSPYASLSAQDDAERRAAADIAQHIRIDLAVHFAHASPK
jgi:LPS-assembly lipoprotein